MKKAEINTTVSQRLITANHLSIFRLIMSPFVCALFLSGNYLIMQIAFYLYILLAATDYADGILARKYGATKFGAFADQFSDKIFFLFFLVTLSLLRLVPFWIVALMIIRDPIICGLRFLSSIRGFELEVETLSRFKTGIQMWGIGAIMLISIYPFRNFTLSIIGIFLLLGLLLFASHLWVYKQLSVRLLMFNGLALLAFLIRYYYPIEDSGLIYALLMLGLTWLTATHYFLLFVIRFRDGTGKVALSWWIISLLESLVLPVILLAFFATSKIPFWIPLSMLFLEFLFSACYYIAVTQCALGGINAITVKLSVQGFLAALIAIKVWLPNCLPPPLNYSIAIDLYLFLGISFILFFLALRQWGKTILNYIGAQ
jgi:CDP-diacylglycerol--glycerol-3-phosphate 3-phosphatidyltransferase